MSTKCSSKPSPVAFCPIPRCSRRSPAKRVRREEEEQGNERSFRRQAETEWSGLCDDEPPWAKSLAARRRRNLPARNETALSSPPHPSGLTASHLPPRGKALCGGAALIRPRGKAYNGRRRNAVSHKILLLTFLLRKVSRWSSLPPEFSHPAPAAPWTSGPPLSAWSAHPQCCGF